MDKMPMKFSALRQLVLTTTQTGFLRQLANSIAVYGASIDSTRVPKSIRQFHKSSLNTSNDWRRLESLGKLPINPSIRFLSRELLIRSTQLKKLSLNFMQMITIISASMSQKKCYKKPFSTILRRFAIRNIKSESVSSRLMS
jgi:hypothetical protein